MNALWLGKAKVFFLLYRYWLSSVSSQADETQGWTNNGKRHAGSPMPKMAVPQFPNRDGGISACVLGEFNEILILTDGYAAEEIVVPGWVAMVGDERDQPYAVPAPASFTVL